MTRKRAVKLLMARGYSRNHANGLMRNKAPGDSNFKHTTHICVVRESAMHLTGSQAAFYNYGAPADVLAKALFLLASL